MNVWYSSKFCASSINNAEKENYSFLCTLAMVFLPDNTFSKLMLIDRSMSYTQMPTPPYGLHR